MAFYHSNRPSIPTLPRPRIPQVWQASTQTWRNLTTASRDVPLYPMNFLAPDGRIFMAGPTAQTAFLDTNGTGSRTLQQ